jgi:hypothetical protein
LAKQNQKNRGKLLLPSSVSLVSFSVFLTNRIHARYRSNFDTISHCDSTQITSNYIDMVIFSCHDADNYGGSMTKEAKRRFLLRHPQLYAQRQIRQMISAQILELVQASYFCKSSSFV